MVGGLNNYDIIQNSDNSHMVFLSPTELMIPDDSVWLLSQLFVFFVTESLQRKNMAVCQ